VDAKRRVTDRTHLVRPSGWPARQAPGVTVQRLCFLGRFSVFTKVG